MENKNRRLCLPFLAWWGELRDPTVLRADIIAGITVALVLIPQSMAYAQLAGLSPTAGLYAAFLPPIVAALFGSSRQLATGPVAMTSLLTMSVLMPFTAAGHSPEKIAAVLALLAGMLRLLLSLLRFGILLSLVSHPVMVGFTNGAAIIIATSQLGKLTGVSVPNAGLHLQVVGRTLLVAAQSMHLPTLAMGCLAFVIMLAQQRWVPRWPGVLLAVIFTTLLSWAIGYKSAGGAVVGFIPSGLPVLCAPILEWNLATSLLSGAVAISVVGFIEASAIARTIAMQTRQRFDANQELLGQGLANIAAAVCQACPVSGSFSRSAVNFKAGACTGFSSVVAGLAVAIVLLYLTPLLYHLPEATLAAVIIISVSSLIRFGAMRRLWHVNREDGAVAFATFGLTLVLAPHLEVAILLGAGLGLACFLYRSMRPAVVVLARHPDGTLRDAEAFNLPLCDHILTIRFDGRLFFANASLLEDTVAEHLARRPGLKVVLFMAHGINAIDASGVETLEHLLGSLEQAGIAVFFCGVKWRVQTVLERSGIKERYGAGRFLRTEAEALNAAWVAVGCDHKERCPLRPADTTILSSPPNAQAEDMTDG